MKLRLARCEIWERDADWQVQGDVVLLGLLVQIQPFPPIAVFDAERLRVGKCCPAECFYYYVHPCLLEFYAVKQAHSKNLTIQGADTIWQK